MERLALQEIVDAVGGKVSAKRACFVGSICTDTRKLEAGCLYIALKGENFDGHSFIEKAIQQGAAAVLSEKEVRGLENIIVVENTEKALLKLSAYYRSRFRPFVVGVTGSVGKTSTKEMIYTILNAKGKTLKTQGNLNNQIGMPMTMFEMSNEYAYAVIEMGMSDLGEISCLSRVCRPNVGVITNIGVSHIETLKTRENIRKAKLEIIDGMSDDAPLILNADDELLGEVNSIISHPIIYFGIENKAADITAENIVQKDTSTYFSIKHYGKSIDAQIPAIGSHNVRNALAGFCVGMLADIPAEQIVAALKCYKNTGLRQSTKIENGVTVIADCYNASPDSMAAALEVLCTVECSGRRICVLGDMLELGSLSEEAHFEVGRSVGRSKTDLLVCYGEQAKHIKRGAITVGMRNVIHFEKKDNLAAYIAQNAKPGDAIIYKASRGMKLEEVIEEVSRLWGND